MEQKQFETLLARAVEIAEYLNHFDLDGIYFDGTEITAKYSQYFSGCGYEYESDSFPVEWVFCDNWQEKADARSAERKEAKRLMEENLKRAKEQQAEAKEKAEFLRLQEKFKQLQPTKQQK